jgi:hypothetical protein
MQNNTQNRQAESKGKGTTKPWEFHYFYFMAYSNGRTVKSGCIDHI